MASTSTLLAFVVVLVAQYLLLAVPVANGQQFNLTSSVVLIPPVTSPYHSHRALAYARVLSDEIHARAYNVHWQIKYENEKIDPDLVKIKLHVLSSGSPEEGYHISLSTASRTLLIEGNDDRSVFYGVGRLLRLLNISFVQDYVVAPHSSILIDNTVDITSHPRYPLRGHQIGYRPKTNSYEAWTKEMMRQFIVDLAIFGTNQIEMVPYNSDDKPFSPHMPVSPLEMMSFMTNCCAIYDLDCSIWYPTMFKDYNDPAVMAEAEAEWAKVFGAMQRLDVLFIPTGDPGAKLPLAVEMIAQHQLSFAQKYFPNVKLWIAPQEWNTSMMGVWNDILRKPDTRNWLTGVAYGPWISETMPTFYSNTPRIFPIRFYPDITHSVWNQFPVPYWDPALASTEARETINPRPTQHMKIMTLLSNYTVGFGGYSEGCNDDVNKAVWSAFHWGSDVGVSETDEVLLNRIIREYARYFGGSHIEEFLSSLILGLERDWIGPLRSNENVKATLNALAQLEIHMTPRDLLKWRLQQLRYRASYDGYVYEKLLREELQEAQCLTTLHSALDGSSESLTVMIAAENILKEFNPSSRESTFRQKMFVLAEGLYQSIRMQLSVPLYGAQFTERGANLDNADLPLNNAPFLLAQFDAIRSISDESQRLQRLKVLVNWQKPPQGSFYDNVGEIGEIGSSHFVYGPGPDKDPYFFLGPASAMCCPPDVDYYKSDPKFPQLPAYPRSWLEFAVCLNLGCEMESTYTNLEKGGSYNVSVVYVGGECHYTGGVNAVVSLLANGFVVHPFIKPAVPMKELTFRIPVAALQSSTTLHLKWEGSSNYAQSKARSVGLSEIRLIRT